MRRIRCCLALVVAVFVFGANVPSARGDVAIEGDAGLLRLLRDAQETNRALFPRGELTAEVSERIEGIQATASIVWDGDKTYWDYWYREPIRTGPTGKRIEISKRRGRMIEKPGVLLCYWPKDRFAQKITDASMGYRRQLKVRPGDIWYNIDLEGRATWGDYLNPDSVPDGSGKFVVNKQGDDRVVVERHFKDGTVMRMEASLKMGGNIVAYEQIPARGSKSFWRKGSYDWEQDKNGNWYLKRYHYQRSSTGDPDKMEFDYTLNITDFNPDPVIPRNRFEFASLELESGTTVKEVGGKGRTYRVGGVGKEQQGVSQNQLDGLAETLRAGGFASPDRNSK